MRPAFLKQAGRRLCRVSSVLCTTQGIGSSFENLVEFTVSGLVCFGLDRGALALYLLQARNTPQQRLNMAA